MKKLFGAVAILFFLSPLSLFATTWSPPKVSTYQLANGFQIYLLENHELPILQAKLFVKVGSAYEEASLAGLADVTADLLTIGGTKNKTPAELDAWLDAKSMQLGSDAGRELTQISVSSLSSEWESLLSILYEVVTVPRWDEDRFALIMGRNEEALRREEDNPMVVVNHALREAVFGKDHPWGRHPTLKSIDRIHLKEAKQFYANYYHPNRMLLAVAGDFSGEKVKKWVEENFGTLKSVEVATPQWKMATLGKASTERIKKKVTQAFIEAGHVGLKRFSPDQYAFSIFQYILGGAPFTSRLGLDIRTESGLAYSVNSDSDTSPVGGLFSIEVQTRADAEKAVLDKINGHLTRLAEHPDVTAEELKLAKEALLSKYIFMFDSPFKVVFQQASFDLLGYPHDYLKQYPEEIKKVTLEKVNAVAKEYLHPESLKTVIVSP